MSEVLHRAMMIGGHVRLDRVTLMSSHAQQHEAPPGEELRVSTEVTTGASHNDAELEAYVRYLVSVRRTAQPESDPVFSIESVWTLSYHLGEASVPVSQVDAEAFALVSGVMAVHPYVREHVSRLTTQMGYEALVLDVVRQAPSIQEADDYEVRLEAESVATEQGTA